jgi:MarR family 2-MHQ and catechol resistance regulon transcriptional repressor
VAPEGGANELDPHRLFKFWSLLRQTYMMLLKSQERSLASHGINVSQYMALFLIRYSGHPITPRAIAMYLAQESASVTYALDRLESRGLIERTPATDDRRETWLSITEAGCGLLGEANLAAWEPLRHFSTVLSDNGELDELMAVLGRLRNRGAEVIGTNVEALEYASEHLAPDPFMFRLWGAAGGGARKGGPAST